MSLPRVLIVDHDPAILKRIRELLSCEKVEISETTSAFEALDLLTRERFQVILADQQMPYLKGAELLEKAREVAPDAVAVLMTEDPGLEIVTPAGDGLPRPFKFIKKPWHDDELMLVFRQALAQSEYRNRKTELDGMQSELAEIGHNMPESNVEWLQEIYQLKLEVKNSQMDSLRILSAMMELQNKPLWKHSRRVALLTRKMAEVLDVPREQRVQLEVASLFHDIGKLGLGREQDLDAELKECPVIGAAIIGMLPEYEEAARAIRFHHERFDGQGYPDGLIGLQIPLMARMIAAADLCEHLLKKNQLKLKSPSAALVCDQLETAGGQLDPDMIHVLREVLNREQQKIEPAGTSGVMSVLYHDKTGPLVENARNLDIPHLQRMGIIARKTTRTEPKSVPQKQAAHVPQAYRQAVGAANGLTADTTHYSAPEGQSIAEYRQQENPAPFSGGEKTAAVSPAVSVPAPQEASVTPALSSGKSQGMGQSFYMAPEPKSLRYAPKTDNDDISWSDVMQMARERKNREMGDDSSATSGHVIDMTRYRKNGKLPDELRINELDLSPGMVLSRDLVTGRGVMILHRNSVIREEYIAKLSTLLEKDPPSDGVYIYNIRYV